MKYIKTFLILLTLIPSITFGAFAVGWNATSTTQGWVLPNLVNGVWQTPVANQFLASFFTATSTTATSTFPNIKTSNIDANTSAGLNIHSNNGTDVGIFGAGNTANTLFYGGVNIDGATRLATSLTGLLKATAGVVSTGANGTDYTLVTGTTCTNQFMRALSSSGSITCATVANTDLANSTISGVSLGGTLAALTAGSGLTSAGTFTGATARTFSLDMASANTWTALQSFANSSTTLGSFGYASTTSLFGANLTTCDPTTGKLTWANGIFGCGTDQSGGGSSLGQSWEIGGNGFIGFLAPTTTQKVWIGQASSTALSANTLSVGSIYGTTTIGVDGSVGIHSSPLANTHLYISTFSSPGDTALHIDGLDNEGVETAISVTDENNGEYFSVRSDGLSGTSGIGYFAGLLGVGTTTPQWKITSRSTTAPQLALQGSNTDDLWTFRSIGNNLYIATSSPTTFATTSISALELRGSGSPFLSIGTTSPTSLGNNVFSSHGAIFVGKKDGITLANSTSTFDGNVRVTGTLQTGDLLFANDFRFVEKYPLGKYDQALYLINQRGERLLTIKEDGTILNSEEKPLNAGEAQNRLWIVLIIALLAFQQIQIIRLKKRNE